MSEELKTNEIQEGEAQTAGAAAEPAQTAGTQANPPQTAEMEAESAQAAKTDTASPQTGKTEDEKAVNTEAESESEKTDETEDGPAQTAETMADYEDHFDDANPWNRVIEYMEKKTVLPVKIEGVVNGGVIAMVEGLRGFIPASKLSLSYIEDLETYLLKDIEVQVIDVDQKNNRLVLSARDILKEKERKARQEQIANIKIGTVMEGTVETLQNYGAFIKMDDGLSGLVHVSQISRKRVKLPSDVLSVGDAVKVKVIGIKEGKISLSMKALEEVPETVEEKVSIPKSENIGTNLGSLLKNIKL